MTASILFITPVEPQPASEGPALYSHVDVWWLEASLVDVVEGEGLRGVGAVLVHLHHRPGAALGAGLGLRLLPPRRHDF